MTFNPIPTTAHFTRSAFFHAIDQLKGTLLIDEVETLANRFQKEFDMGVLTQGYKKSGKVVRLDPGSRKLRRFKCFGPKVIANIGGIYSKLLRSRCIVIKTIEAESDIEPFSISRDGTFLKELSSGIRALFKRKKIQNEIKVCFHNLRSVEGVRGRDLELWKPFFVLAKIIESERPGLKLFDSLVKTAISSIEARDEESFFKHWDNRALFEINDFLTAHHYEGKDYFRADKITAFIKEKVQTSFRLRTETIGKLLDKHQLITHRMVIRFKDIKWFKGQKEEIPIQRTGWLINVERLKRLVAKYLINTAGGKKETSLFHCSRG